MLITGIRHQINAEYDLRRSALFMRYLFHFLQMFAWMGIIIPILIGVDYYCDPQSHEEKVTNKFYKSWDNMNHVEYHIFTDFYHFLSDNAFYENTVIGDKVTFYYTPIFKTITDVSRNANSNVYVCKPDNVYGWPIIVAGLTFICSIIVVILNFGWRRKRKYLKFDAVTNLGIVNMFLCAIIIVAILFRILY